MLQFSSNTHTSYSEGHGFKSRLGDGYIDGDISWSSSVIAVYLIKQKPHLPYPLHFVIKKHPNIKRYTAGHKENILNTL
jgi:hypothetical protein